MTRVRVAVAMVVKEEERRRRRKRFRDGLVSMQGISELNSFESE